MKSTKEAGLISSTNQWWLNGEASKEASKQGRKQGRKERKKKANRTRGMRVEQSCEKLSK